MSYAFLTTSLPAFNALIMVSILITCSKIYVITISFPCDMICNQFYLGIVSLTRVCLAYFFSEFTENESPLEVGRESKKNEKW